MKKQQPMHYGWIIVLTGMAVLFSCLGLGRFSLGMLLPSMSISLGLNYSQMGLIGTGNFVGYMIAVFLAGIIARAIGARMTISLGLVLVGGSMVLISLFIAAVAMFFLRNEPGEKGLTPLGEAGAAPVPSGPGRSQALLLPVFWQISPEHSAWRSGCVHY